MSEDKKVTAAIAAVVNYIEEEEAAVQLQSAMPGRPTADARRSTAALKPWGIHGRQMQMQLRNLMQLRTFGTKPGG